MNLFIRLYAALVNIAQYAGVLAENPVFIIPLILWTLKH